MKLYMHPASTTSRAVMLFVADAKIDLEQEQVDIFKGDQYGESGREVVPGFRDLRFVEHVFELITHATLPR